MVESNDNQPSPELEKFLFMEEMNARYYPPREIGYRIPAHLKDQQLLPLILSLREKKAEPQYPLLDQAGNPFRLWKTPAIEKIIHRIDTQKSQWLESGTSPGVLQELLIQNLIDEAFYSSWIEGAKTTRQKAEELARKKITPETRSEQMCLNNYRAMQFIVKNLNRSVDEKFVLELHRILTKKTLDPQDEPFAGKYRNDLVVVYDEAKNKVDYTAPAHDKVPEMMNRLLEWINFDNVDSLFVHPAIKASMIHFYTVYVHPFFDGNGRTARALMYHYLLKHGYDFMQYFSISKAIAANRKAYYDSLLNTEQVDSDLTYFVLFSVKMIEEAITTVELEKRKETSLASWLTKIQSSGANLNQRQERLFKFHFRNSLFPITISKYQKIFHVVYQTARTDLLNLAEHGLLETRKNGREFVFDLKGK
ncbi:MAG: Fic family protein [Deltaproteobacteria bacterium]|nr:Fic family protein [Deltaproteobacteria bacterium]